jgi:LytS/YehU family sensor histidine kinase
MIGLLLYFDVLWPKSPWGRWLKIIRTTILFLILPGFILAVITRPTFVVFALAEDIKIVTRVLVGAVTCLSCIHAAVRKKIPSVVAYAYTLFVISTVYDILRDKPTTYSWTLLLFLLSLTYTNQKRMIFYHAGLKESKILLLESKLETLKAQLQPHFLFNSLNTLSSLIFISRERAAGFTRKLATVYRIILESRGKSTVSLEKEMALANAYLHLIQTRFDGGLSVTVSVDEQLYQKQVVPLSIQLLVENAVKHNIVSKKQPLMLSIRTTRAPGIAVKNSLQIKPVSPGSPKLGLKSIKTSYGLLTDRPVSIRKSSEDFTVRLPLL